MPVAGTVAPPVTAVWFDLHRAVDDAVQHGNSGALRADVESEVQRQRIDGRAGGCRGLHLALVTVGGRHAGVVGDFAGTHMQHGWARWTSA